MGIFKKNRNEDNYSAALYQINSGEFKEAVEKAKKAGNLFINVIKYSSLYSGDNVFKDNLSELRDYIMRSTSKILGFVESEFSIILYSNENLDLIATAIKALDETSTRNKIMDSDPSSLYILSLSLVLDFDKGIIKKVKNNILDCQKIFKEDNSDYNLVFNTNKVIESDEFDMEKYMPAQAKKSLIDNPSNVKELIKKILTA